MGSKQVFVWDCTSTYIYISWERQLQLTGIRFGEWEAKWFLKHKQSFPRQRLIPVVSWGLYIFRAEWETPHPCLEKIFILFLPLLMSLQLLWRGSECWVTLLEKSTLTYFCTANSPLHGLFFINIGLLKVVRINTKQEMCFCPNYLDI